MRTDDYQTYGEHFIMYQVSNHYVVHLKLRILCINYISIKTTSCSGQKKKKNQFREAVSAGYLG